jgi:hypothetical protein
MRRAPPLLRDSRPPPIFCNKKLTNLSRKFLYDAEIVAGSPLKFEKYPQDISSASKRRAKTKLD